MMFLATLIMFGVAVAHWGLTMVFFMKTMLASILSCDPATGTVPDFVAREWLPLINVCSFPFQIQMMILMSPMHLCSDSSDGCYCPMANIGRIGPQIEALSSRGLLYHLG